MLMSWEKNLELGVEEMDKEHMELVNHANALFEAMKSGNSDAFVVKHLEFLKAYTIHHFDHEEAFQKKIGYPDCEGHKVIHEAFKKVVSDLLVEVKTKGLGVKKRIEVNQMTMTWIRQHIGKEDKKVALFYKNL